MAVSVVFLQATIVSYRFVIGEFEGTIELERMVPNNLELEDSEAEVNDLNKLISMLQNWAKTGFPQNREELQKAARL